MGERGRRREERRREVVVVEGLLSESSKTEVRSVTIPTAMSGGYFFVIDGDSLSRWTISLVEFYLFVSEVTVEGREEEPKLNELEALELTTSNNHNPPSPQLLRRKKIRLDMAPRNLSFSPSPSPLTQLGDDTPTSSNPEPPTPSSSFLPPPPPPPVEQAQLPPPPAPAPKPRKKKPSVKAAVDSVEGAVEEGASSGSPSATRGGKGKGRGGGRGGGTAGKGSRGGKKALKVSVACSVCSLEYELTLSCLFVCSPLLNWESSRTSTKTSELTLSRPTSPSHQTDSPPISTRPGS